MRFYRGPDSKMITSVLLVAVLVGCALPAFGQSGKKTLENQLANDEQQLVRAERQHDTSAFNRLLRDDLIYVAFNGWVFTKKELLSKMQYIDVEKYDPENMKVRLPSGNTALITYDLKAKASIAGHELPKSQYVSSLWVRKGSEWQLLFHQATPATHP